MMKSLALRFPTLGIETNPSSSEANAPDDGADRTIKQLTRENAELRRELAKLEVFRALAYRDPLTGLGNRRYFEERLGEELSRTRRDSVRRFSVLIIDLNDLKRINDNQGHTAGDRVLKWVGAFLKNTLRGYDVSCRIGGDEFAVLLPDTGAPECVHLIARLRQELENANRRRTKPVGLSFGTATYLEHGATAESLLEAADEAMYRDKRRQKTSTPPAVPMM